MKININDTKKINNILNKVQQSQSIDTEMDFDFIQDLSKKGEQLLEKYPEKKGNLVSYEIYLPTSYNKEETFTKPILYRGDKDWFLVDCFVSFCKKTKYEGDGIVIQKTKKTLDWFASQHKL